MQRKQEKQATTAAIAEKLLGKNLPFSLEAERAVLGALLLHDAQLEIIMELIEPKDFYSSAHRIIFEAMTKLAYSKQRLDIITVQDELQKVGQLDAVGGVVFLLSLQEDIPAVGLIEQHGRIIKEKAVLRDLIHSATQIITNCYAQNNKGIEGVLDEAERIIFQISQKRAQESFVQLTIWLKKTFQHLSNIQSHEKGITGIPSGYRSLMN